MKKIIVISFVIVLTACVAYAKCLYTWAEAYPTKIAADKADHVYVCMSEKAQSDKNVKAYAYHGGTKGGWYLSDTMGTADDKISNCLATTPGKCSVGYLTEGVCHQEANRMLYASQKLVTKAKGYWIFYKYYGHYGNNSSKWKDCRRACKCDGAGGSWGVGGAGGSW